MKKRLSFFAATTALAIVTALLTSGKMDYTAAKAKTFPPKTKQTIIQPKKPAPAVKITASKKIPVKKTAVPPKPLPIPSYTTASEVKKMIASEIEKLITEGKLTTSPHPTDITFDTLHKLNNNFSNENTSFQSVYIPVAALPDVGTFFSATNISADNTSGNNATFSNLTVGGAASLNGGLSLTAPTDGDVITADSGAYLSPGGVWTNASSKSLKENFTALNGEEILQKINVLDINQWNYIKEPSSTYHIGPIAEDFYDAFGLGGSAGTKSISTIDPAGVALVGIQTLSKKITDLSWIIEGIKQFGITLETGLVRVKTLLTDTIHTDSLKIGSSDLPTGITIYDKATKQPMCIEVENGSIQIQSGTCITVIPTTSPASADTRTSTTPTEIQIEPSLPIANASSTTPIVPEPEIVVDPASGTPSLPAID